MINIKNTLNKIIYKIFKKPTKNSENFIRYLRSKGVRIGENSVFYAPKLNVIDLSRPWLIEIGDNVKITAGVSILTHGYDWSVLRNKFNGEVIGSAGKVKIGNNVFIGINSTILKGVSIGENVIIGANSLITNDIPDNVVVGGNPAKIIMSIDEYYDKRKKVYINESEEMAIEYYKVYGKIPPLEVFREHYFLFLDRDINIDNVRGIDYKFDKEDKNDVLEYFKNSKPIFDSYEEYIKYVFNKHNIII